MLQSDIITFIKRHCESMFRLTWKKLGAREQRNDQNLTWQGGSNGRSRKFRPPQTADVALHFWSTVKNAPGEQGLCHKAVRANLNQREAGEGSFQRKWLQLKGDVAMGNNDTSPLVHTKGIGVWVESKSQTYLTSQGSILGTRLIEVQPM